MIIYNTISPIVSRLECEYLIPDVSPEGKEPYSGNKKAESVFSMISGNTGKLNKTTVGVFF